VPRLATVLFESRTEAMCGFNVAGPQSRALLQGLTNASLATQEFPFMRSSQISVAGVDVIAIRVSFTGDLGWELHCDAADQQKLYSALLEAGKQFGAGPVGSRALMSLRVEKGYGSWGREYSPEYWPQETGLAPLIKMDKEFLNKAAYAALMERAPRETLAIVEVLETDDADATGGEPIFRTDGTPAGRVTSGTYGYSVGKSLALCYLRDTAPGDEVHVMVLGRPHRGVVLDRPPFDPEGTRLRA
jgi:dimethylglycine dehydrogenase